MKTIIVPTDFSPNAYNALQYALALARKMPARILLFHNYHLPASNTTTLRDISPILKQDAETGLRQVLNQIKQDPLNTELTIETVARRGHLVEQIKGLIKDEKADLVVMGTKGASGLSELFIGTNTASVIDQTTCPVLAVPEQASFKAIQHILYATNYMTSDFESISQLTQIAALFNASIVMVHVSEEGTSAQQENASLEAFAREVGQKIAYPYLQYRLVESHDIYNGLSSTIQDLQIDLIATTTQRRNLYQKLFSNSLTKQMAYHTHIPMLAFHC